MRIFVAEGIMAWTSSLRLTLSPQISQITRIRKKEKEDEKVRRLERGKSFEGLRFRHTWDIILAAERGLLPDRIMIKTHPQRWGKGRRLRSELRDGWMNLFEIEDGGRLDKEISSFYLASASCQDKRK